MIRADARTLPIRSGSVACVITSPPYNVDADYGAYTDVMSWQLYRGMAYRAMFEIERVLEEGGRCWLNVQHTVPMIPRARDRTANVQGRGREERMNLLQLWADVAEDVGLKYRDTVAWVQDAHDGQAAWGSWLRPSAPNLRGGWEAILVLYKTRWKRTRPVGTPAGYLAPQWLVENEYEGSWMSLVRNVWNMRTRRLASHAAVFPDELVRRCVLLSTWPGEHVLDPFAGSGTTARVAQALGRVGIGVDRYS